MTKYTELNISNVEFYLKLDISNVEFQNNGVLLHNLKSEQFGYIVKKLRLFSYFCLNFKGVQLLPHA